jgi:hypothetical protein
MTTATSGLYLSATLLAFACAGCFGGSPFTSESASLAVDDAGQDVIPAHLSITITLDATPDPVDAGTLPESSVKDAQISVLDALPDAMPEATYPTETSAPEAWHCVPDATMNTACPAPAIRSMSCGCFADMAATNACAQDTRNVAPSSCAIIATPRGYFACCP